MFITPFHLPRSRERHQVRLRPSRFTAALTLCLGLLPAANAQGQLRPVTVTATRTDAAVDDVPATITTLDGEQVRRRLPADETDLLKDEPDIAVSRDLRRFGSTRVNIRGIDDNRVTQMVDGVRMPDFYNSGGPTNFTMSAPLGTSIDFLKRVEILRGPASSLYGSDTIGGAVGYLTLDPSDLLTGDQASALRYRLGYTGVNKGLSNTVLGAWRGACRAPGACRFRSWRSRAWRRRGGPHPIRGRADNLRRAGRSSAFCRGPPCTREGALARPSP